MRFTVPASVLLLFVLSGCEIGDRFGDATPIAQVERNITINSDIATQSLGTGTNTKLALSLGDTPTDVYLLLSNHSQSSSDSSTKITNNTSSTVASPIASKSSTTYSDIYNAPQEIRDSNRDATESLLDDDASPKLSSIVSANTPRQRVVGESRVLYTSQTKRDSTNTTLRLKNYNVETKLGNKTLYIWVSDNAYGDGCPKSRCVTQAMVDTLGDKFLKTGEDNDIYDWVTNIYGEEWTSSAHDKYSKLIGASDEIHILLTDIEEDDSPNRGAIGYFSKKDNFKKTLLKAGSNEQIMFYIDSVMFANGGASWSTRSYIPSRAISTLAHEFGHMILFYQKAVMLTVNRSDTDEWLDEMLAVTTEDILDTKLQQTGSRGVSYTDGSAGRAYNSLGKYPTFNANISSSLTNWRGEGYSYAQVSSLGAFLVRNYGGVKILHDIMHSSHTNKMAIVEAVNNASGGAGKTFEDILAEWGVAVLLSDQISPEHQPTYNTGDFTYDTYNDIIYALGSINFYNYNPKPTISNTLKSIDSQSNYYYRVGEALLGDIVVDIELNRDTEATIITKR